MSASSANAPHKATRVFITGASGFVGTNLVAHYEKANQYIIRNFDIAEPRLRAQRSYHVRGDILDACHLTESLLSFEPDIVIHLAARTDEASDDLTDYESNITGTRNVLEATRRSTAQRVIVTSSQAVIGQGDPFDDIYAYKPHTAYAQSKVRTEQITRELDLPITWSIIRPVNLWGPWHQRYKQELWKYIQLRLYWHPKGITRRCYGYIGNVVQQIATLERAPHALVHRRVFYLGDKAIEYHSWTNAFSIALTGHPVRCVRKPLLVPFAKLGDALRAVGVSFPLNSRRLKGMTEDWLSPVTSASNGVFGEAAYSMEAGVQETVAWLRSHGGGVYKSERL
jgi:GlcNAc-P-P-Und epimerase